MGGYSTKVPDISIQDLINLNTLVDLPRRNKLVEFLEETKHLNGPIVEVGVYKGGTTLLLGSNTTKQVFAIDTFEGLPQEVAQDNHHKKGDFNDTSLEYVQNLTQKFANITVIKALFSKFGVKELENKNFSLVHIDVDIYNSVKDCLEYFYPRMLKGGIIILDDYDWKYTIGCKVATDEFLAGKPEKLMITVGHQAAFRKL